MNKFAYYFLNNIGGCMGCMRQSFQIAAISWVATLALLPFKWEEISYLGLAASTALSTLWVTHLLVFSFRNSVSANAGSASIPMPSNLFLQNLAFAAAETAVLYRPGLKDRFGRPLFGRRFLVELKNPDGSRTAYLKNANDVDALVKELKSRGYRGEVVTPEYWMSTDSCERSAAGGCGNHTCDVASKSCRSGSMNGACRCL